MRRRAEAETPRTERAQEVFVRRDIELVVQRTLVRNADRRVADAPSAQHTTRIDELRRQVRAGEYDTAATLDAVARRILRSGDL